MTSDADLKRLVRARMAREFPGDFVSEDPGDLAESGRDWTRVVRTPRPVDSNASDNLALMVGLAREVLDGRRPLAIGVSFGGPVDSERGVVRKSLHVAGWEGVPLAERLSIDSVPANPRTRPRSDGSGT